MGSPQSISRRTLIRGTGIVAIGGLAGCFDQNYGAGASESADAPAAEPDYGEWFDDAAGFDATVDKREDDAVTVAVGAGEDGFAYDPAAVAVSPDTTVTFEWTGEGGAHNVLVRDGPADIEHEDLEDQSGLTNEATVSADDAGITRYYCMPHEAQGMKGAVVVANPDDDLSELTAEE